MLADLRPLLAQVDPALRQLNPMLDYLGLYKRELTAFFANTVAGTQATTVSSKGPLHYLRTTNPFNPENLAVYPKRLPHRTGPTRTRCPATSTRSARGLPAYETRHCGRDAFPTIVNTPTADRRRRTAAGAHAARAGPGPGAGRRERGRRHSTGCPTSLFADILRFAFPNGHGERARGAAVQAAAEVRHARASRRSIPHLKPQLR